MTPTGAQRTSRTRRVMLAAAAFGATAVAALSAVGPTETMAAVTGNLWAGSSEGLRAAGFQIQSSLTPDGPFADHTIDGPIEMAGSTSPGSTAFAAPIVVQPGETTYVPVYLRTSPDSGQAAQVTVAAAQKLDDIPGSGVTSDDNLWNTYVSYGARAWRVGALLPSSGCNANPFTGTGLTTDLIFGHRPLLDGSDNYVALDDPSTGQTFTLAANAGNTYLVCFRFHLNNAVKTQSPTSNGKSVHPYWVFTGVAQ